MAVELSAELKALHNELGISPTYIDTCRLPCYTTPTDLVSVGNDIYGREQFLREPAARAWFEMRSAAKAEHVDIELVSAYRSAAYQAHLIQRYLDRGEGVESVLTRIAPPGYSEHQSGCAVDLATRGSEPVEVQFEETRAFTWLSEHAAEHNFFLSFPRENPYGIDYEPWHWCHDPSR